MKALRAILFVGIVVATDRAWAGESNPDFGLPAPGTYTLPPLRPAGDGAVLTAEGGASSLHRLFNGKIVILSFIYTQCRDARGCPLASAVLAQLRRRVNMDPMLSQRVRLISLSFDPTHDTPAVMRAYGARFVREGADWQFLTADSEAALQPILDAYRQPRQKAPDGSGKPSAYAHLLRVFLIDDRRMIRNVYSADFLDPTLLVNDVTTLARETGPTGADQPALGRRIEAIYRISDYYDM